MYITNESDLAKLVDKLRQASVVGMDTEFMRERTYFAKLCLVQVASDDVAAIIDPLAIKDMSSFAALLTDPNVVKVFHAGGQDLEIFYRQFGVAAAPVYDVQVAATLAGFGQQIGYGALVQELLGVKLDKGDTFTDWQRRPLTDTQVEYALNDVRYLPEMYRRLSSKLDAEKRTSWMRRDIDRMEDASTYIVVPEEQWRRVKRVSSLNRRQLGVVREVAAWRELEAMRRDVPKRWVLGDESLIEVARRAPKTESELQGIRGVGEKLGRSASRDLLVAIGRGLEVPDEDLPTLTKRRRPAGDIDGAVDLMVALVRLRAKSSGVAMPLLASRDDLERLAAGERENHPLLEGWRADMVGNELIELLDGRLTLRLDNGDLVVSPTESTGLVQE